MSDNKYMKRVVTERVFKEFKDSSIEFVYYVKLHDAPISIFHLDYKNLETSYTCLDYNRSILSFLYEIEGKKAKQIETYNNGLENFIITSEEVKKPSRYNKYEIETIEMMKRIFGLEEVIKFCEMTAFKYRMRLGHKDEIDLELAKEKEYLEMAERFKSER